jgi:hypothetical protein
MSAASLSRSTWGVLRHSPWDAMLVTLAAGHGALLVAVPSAPVIALGLWWNSNTVAHWFIHRPYFGPRPLNLLFSLYLSLLLGIPQALWRERHLAHHAGVTHRWRWSRQLFVESCAVLLLWTLLLCSVPHFFLGVYLPGYFAGLGICLLHGHYEHAQGTTSHYGLLYNLLFFNDGYHVEHHAHPSEHWTRLLRQHDQVPGSRWPAVLRWLEWFSLDGLERCVLHSSRLQRFMLARHERAFRRLLREPVPIHSVVIVGGGLFPRTLLVLQQILPTAEFTILDAKRENLETVERFVESPVNLINAWYTPEAVQDFDLVIFPLAFRGDRAELYHRPPARRVIIHDWIWKRSGPGVVVSWLLLKRLNLVLR